MYYLTQKQGRLSTLLLYFIFCSNYILAQINLVPNPSFEQYTNCPTGAHEWPNVWYKPDKGYGEYLNACRLVGIYPAVPYTGLGSIQYAHTGVAFVGMFYRNGNYNNYFAVKLTDSLKASKNYYVEFYAVPRKVYHRLACNNVGLLLTKKAIYADTANGIKIIPANPQIVGFDNPIIKDTTQWTKISAIYKAQGGEQYITLGNFKDANQTNYIINNTGSNFAAVYFIDDVSVIPLDSFCLKADAGKDTTITIGDSIFIGSFTNGLDSVKWLQGTTVIDSTRPGFWVKPTTGTSYILQQTVNGCFSSDTVYINVLLPLRFISYTLRQAQGDKVENFWTTANEINVSHFNIQRSLNGKDFITIGTQKAQNKSYNEYSFTDVHLPSLEGLGVGLFYRIQSIDKDGKTNYTEIKRININDKQEINGVIVYPNPASSIINILDKNVTSIQITDMLGKQEMFIAKSSRLQTINVSSLTNGLHFVKVQKADGSFKISKLIIQH